MNNKKSGFPYKNFWRIPIGWINLGDVNDFHSVENGKTITKYSVHNLCKTRLCIGKENGDIFRYCPRCEIKITDD